MAVIPDSQRQAVAISAPRALDQIACKTNGLRALLARLHAGAAASTTPRAPQQRTCAGARDAGDGASCGRVGSRQRGRGGALRGAVPGMRKPRGAEERSGRRRAAPTRATAAGAKASEGAMAEMATTAARNARENMLGSSVALDTTTTLKAFVCVLSVTWAYILYP